MDVKQWTVEVYISEDDSNTLARAVLCTRDSKKIIGTGRARRRPTDPPVPEIGDEIAVARALADLADRLSGVAAADVSQMAHPT
jgi:Rv2632c-like